MKKKYFAVLLLLTFISCINTKKETSEVEFDDHLEQAEDSLTIEFVNGIITQNYDPKKYDLYRNIEGEFCFKTNYPKGTKAIISTYHYVESAADEPEFEPFYDTIELTSSLCHNVIGTHVFGTVGFKIPMELQTEKIKIILNEKNRIEEIFFNIVNKDIAKDTIHVEVQRNIP